VDDDRAAEPGDTIALQCSESNRSTPNLKVYVATAGMTAMQVQNINVQ